MQNKEEFWMKFCSYLERKTLQIAQMWDPHEQDFAPLFVFVLKAAAAGHFCVRVTEQEVYPSVYDVIEEDLLDEEKFFLDRWEDMIKKARGQAPSWLGHFWSPFSPFLLYRVQDYFLLPRFMGILDSLLCHLSRLHDAYTPLPWMKKECPDLLNPEQQICFEEIQNQSVHFLLGGPGTGKSFTSVSVIQFALDSGFRVAVLAPTGKAVTNLKKRLPSADGCFFGTIHRALGLSNQVPFRSRLNPIPYDFILVDECSMIDALLFSDLLQAIPTGARVLFMGDVDQLPSVEMDGAFSLLVEWGKKNRTITQLETSIRMETESLGSLTQFVLSGDVESFVDLLQKDEALHWIDQPVVSNWFEEICTLFGSWLKQWLFASLYDASALMDSLKILVPIRIGESGSDQANRLISSWMCRLARKQNINTFFMPVLLTKNFPLEGLCNGDQGIISVDANSTSLPLSTNRVSVLYRDEKGDFLERKMSSHDLSYGWCLSVHKSQGSEFDHVVVVLPKASSRLLNQQLLYTALTRAKKKITIWAQRSELELALSKRLLRSESGLMRSFD